MLKTMSFWSGSLKNIYISIRQSSVTKKRKVKINELIVFVGETHK